MVPRFVSIDDLSSLVRPVGRDPRTLVVLTRRRSRRFGFPGAGQLVSNGQPYDPPCMQLPEVLSCHKITGDADYVLQVLAEELDSYSDFIEQVLRRQVGIASIQSSLALREVKASSRIAIPKASQA